jgi:hypothetical protein
MAAATSREGEEEGGRPDRELTGNPPVGSAWPEDGRRRRIRRQRRSVSGEESATPATIPGAGLRFFELGGRGRLWGPSQLVGEAGAARNDDLRRRPWRSSSLLGAFSWERERERAREKVRERRESWHGWLLQGVFSEA